VKKTVAFKNPVKAPNPADSWVSSRSADAEAPAPAPVEPEHEAAAPAEAMKRFTIDVPASLHTRVKIGCAQRGLKMADVLREMLEREFPG
jgi:predicted cobalt transporter CbtA